MPEDKPEPEQLYPPVYDTCDDYRKPAVEFTMERRMRYLYELRKTGLHYKSAQVAGVSATRVLKLRKEDPDFDAAVRMAKNLFVDEVLVKAAVTRAVDGVERPIIGGKDRDQVVATEQVYSDSLLALLLKSQRGDEFREPKAGDAGKYNQEGGVIIVPASPATPEEWEAQYGEMANPKK